ncbi:MAG: YcaO-like family protein [Gemmatimonadaceae bacterium]
MRKQAGRRIGQSPSREPKIVVIGSPSEPLAAKLKQAFGRAVFCEDLAALGSYAADLALGVFQRSDEESITGFAKLTRVGNALPSLCVMLADYEALIGPVSLADRAGCARCAWERMLAASGVERWTPDLGVSPGVVTATARALLREIRAIVREGAEHSQLVGHVLALEKNPDDAVLHRVIPLHRCRACGGAQAFPRPPHDTVQLSANDSPEIVFEALAGLVDQRTGVISGVYLEPPIDRGLPFIATAAPPRIVEEDDSIRTLPIGWGKGLTVSGAVISASGEAIERYSGSLPDQRKIQWERAEDLDCEFLDPRELSLYTDAQYDRPGFPHVRFNPGAPHPWIRGKWLGNDKPVWVPAVFAFLSFDLQPENLICQGSSNGLAAATDEDDAILRATMELVERDAFMTCWLTAQPGRRMQLDDTLDPMLLAVLDAIEALGATVETYMLPTSACGATILCLALGDGIQYPGATLGLGASLDSRSALRQAILELGQTGPYLQRMMSTKILPVPDDPTSVHEMLQHASYYFPAARANAFDRLRSTIAPIALRSLPQGPIQSLAACASQLKKAKVRIATVDVTSADVATGPFRVVRAVSPDLQPIWYGYGLERQQVPRVRVHTLSAEAPPIHPIW